MSTKYCGREWNLIYAKEYIYIYRERERERERDADGLKEPKEKDRGTYFGG